MALLLLSGCVSKDESSSQVERVWVKKQNKVAATHEELKAAKDKCEYDRRMSKLGDIVRDATGRDVSDDLRLYYAKKYQKVMMEATKCMFDLGYVKIDKVENSEKS